MNAAIFDVSCEAVVASEEAYDYECFAGRPDQAEMLDALDYDDRMARLQPASSRQFLASEGEGADSSTKIVLFYVCRAHNGECGMYYAGKLWKKVKTHKWQCGLDMTEFQKIPGVGDLTGFRDPGCGATYRPWARGEGMVLEFEMSDGNWGAILCDLLPEILDDEIKKVQSAWYAAYQKVDWSALYEEIPIVCPKV